MHALEEGLKSAQKKRSGRHAMPDSAAAAAALPHQKVLKATPIQGAAKRMLAAAAALSADHTLERGTFYEPPACANLRNFSYMVFI